MKFLVRYNKHDYATLPEMTREYEVDPGKLGFVLIDYQNDFLHDQGLMGSKGGNMSAARQVIKPSMDLAAACRQKGARVIYTVSSVRPDLIDMGRAWREVYYRSRAPVGPGSAVGPKGEKIGYYIEGTWNTRIFDECTPHEGDIVIDRKHTHTGFYHTDMEHILRNLGIEVLMFGGLTTSICVESSLRDAFHSEFICILLSDCCWEKSPLWQKATEEIVKTHFGYVTASAEVIKGLKAA